MIQRIQTVYLLLVAILGILTLCFPIMGICSPDVGLSKIYALGSLWCTCMGGGAAIWSKLFGLVALLIPLLALFTIFMFKKRTLQIKLSIAIVLLILLFYLFSILFLTISYRHISEIPHLYGSFSLNLPLAFFFNAIGFVLSILAIVAIRRDESMVRSLDRIR